MYIMYFISQTQHAMKKPHLALKTVNKAIQSMPKNALCKYHKASFLYTLERYEVSYCLFLTSMVKKRPSDVCCSMQVALGSSWSYRYFAIVGYLMK